MRDSLGKPHILIFVDYYLPSFQFGGPSRSICNLVDHLGQDFRLSIVTRDRDPNAEAAFPDVGVNTWNQVGGARVFYAAPGRLTLAGIARIVRETSPDAIYLNSFFSPRMTLLPLLALRLGFVKCARIIVAPRGEFSHSALRLKAMKKRLFLWVTKVSALYHDVVWQATSEQEAFDICRAVGVDMRHVHVAANLPRRRSASGGPKRFRQPDEPLRLVFLSRISPMKNLRFAIEVLARVQVPVDFSIYGPKEDEEYWRACESAVAHLPAHIRVAYRGSVETEDVISTLENHDLFFLPTLGENFGHVIVEAFQAGLPVLLSDRTPWRGLEALGVGRDLPLEEKQRFTEYIEHVSGLNAAQSLSLRRRVLDWAGQFLNVYADKERLRFLLGAHSASK